MTRVLLSTYGTLGDVEPLLALATQLRALGAEVRMCVPPDEEFVISHSDNVQATGYVEHLKLPHYVDFQAELDLVRRMRREFGAARNGDEDMKEAAE